jgi:hypothetical protein
MNRALSLLTAGLVMSGPLLGGVAIAEEQTPLHIRLHLQGASSGSETDYVNGTCDQKAGTLKCHLTSSFIPNPKGQAEIQTDIDKQLPYWTKDVQSKSREHLCSYLNMTNDSQFRSRSTPQAKQLLERQDATTNAMCADPSESNIKAMMRARIAVDDATCQVYSVTGDETFTRRFSSKSFGGVIWVSNSGKPEGLCGTINIGRLSQNSQNPNDWTYEQRSIVTKPGGGLCPNQSEVTAKFIWTLNTGVRECTWVVIY